ncbi:MAG: hypothetical protein ACYSSO_05570 [Planctomycetota bacterium]|jgi:hypothetical protein
MECKGSGDEGAWPNGVGHFLEDVKQEQGIYYVKEQISQVMPVGVKAEEVTVEDMAEPGQGVPVFGMRGGEGPNNRLTGQAGDEVGVLGYVFIVIIVDELIFSDRLKGNKSGEGQACVNKKNIQFIGCLLHQRKNNCNRKSQARNIRLGLWDGQL